MKNLFAVILLTLSGASFAQDTGQFEITKTNFKDLYNTYRFAAPKAVPWAGNFFPYADRGTAVKLDPAGDKKSGGRSPMESYALISGGSTEAEDWEKETHGCDGYDAATKKACKAWWGHCNGWAAAGIKEKEPRASRMIRGHEFSVADQKGILSELWLSSYSINAGITDKDVKTGPWVHEHDKPTESYNSFWDVSPRSFFLIFTNYVGALKTGIVIDRFTGDEVWNQPIVGYRLLPIRQGDIDEVRDGNRKYWSVKVRIKIYWANDVDIRHGHISKGFDIAKMKDSEDLDSLSADYDGRYLAFRLNFDSKVTVSSDGKKVLTAGKMVGDGIWEHQENSRDLSYDDLNHTHPDFIWLPTQSFQDVNGYGNPHINPAVVQKMIDGKESAPAKEPVQLRLSFAPRYFEGAATTPESAKKIVQSVIRRDGIKHSIYLKDIEISRNKVVVVVRFPLGVDSGSLVKLFNAAGMPLKLE
ncbi:MAG TPA: hypothetical protein VNJ08_07640 [Bacteriovoracaceae bacterium]|nr:hypothetical protein [Bacteriovoracaceae bacterium]